MHSLLSRRNFLRAVGAGSATAVAGCNTLRTSGDGRSYRNPVYEPLFPDPTVIRIDRDGDPINTEWERDAALTASDSVYYAYGTMMGGYRSDSKERPVPILKSDDLVEWKHVGNAFEQLPDWVPNPEAIWAPDVAHHGGRYLLFYSLVPDPMTPFTKPDPSAVGPSRYGIGVAEADAPDGPFTDLGTVGVTGVDDGQFTPAIDPHFFVDDGTPYLLWGSDSIRIARMNSAGTAVVEESTTLTGPGFQEAGYLIERRGYYYLFYSNKSCCPGYYPGYNVRVGRSRSVKGPYVNALGDPIEEWAGTRILDHNDRFGGPGHNSVVTFRDGTDWTLYHAYDTNDPAALPDGTFRRVLMVDPLRWRNGWPVVPGREPSAKRLAPGRWKRSGDL